MKTLHIFILFILVAVAQLFIPAKMIWHQEDILKTGTAYKFKTKPIDPYDPFRGKYITLRYEIDSAPANDTLWQGGDKAFLYLKEDSLGFATVDTISKQKLEGKKDYVKLEIDKYGAIFWDKESEHEVRFSLPFNRFYMEESKAKPAEDVYREAQRDSLPNNIYGLVYIKDGEAVLKDVIVNDMSISKYVEE